MPSNEVAVTVGGCVSAPRTPHGLTARANGPAVTLTSLDDDGCEDRRYRLLVGSRSGVADLGSLLLTGPRFSGAVPPGQYSLRVVTETDRDVKRPSNEVAVAGAGVCRPPDFAIALDAGSLGGVLDLHWRPVDAAAAESADAATPLAYVLEAGLAPSSVNLGVFPLGRGTSVAAPVPSGHYYLRVRATSACGPGPASNEVAVAVQ
jgi:hypothetical protein